MWVSLLCTALSAAIVVSWGGFRAHGAHELVGDARDLLIGPIELDRVSASRAARQLRQAQELGRNDDAVFGWVAFAHAVQDYQHGDMVLAEGELVTARHHLHRNADIEVLAAAVARGRSKPEEARRLLAEAGAIDAHNKRYLAMSADFALDADDGRAALRHLDVLVRIAPHSAAVHNRRGLAHELVGRLDEAEDDYLEAVRYDSRADEAWINLGRLRRQDGRHIMALAAFDRAIEVAPTDSEAHLGRGLSRAAIGDVAGARIAFARAAELAPNDAEPLLALGDLQRDTGEYTTAAETYRRAIAREDADAASWLKLGNVLALLERYREAAAAFENAIRRAPSLAAAHNGLGASLMHLGEREEATLELDRAATLDAHDPNPFMNLALLHERGGDRNAAIEAWERALERDPASIIARRHLARLRS
jgi:tetratricopeptide (TPR) repeat protein